MKNGPAGAGTAGLAGVIAFIAQQAGVILPPEVLAASATVVGYVARHLLGDSKSDD